MTELTDLRRRHLRSFCRHYVAAEGASKDVRQSIRSLALAIDSGGLSRADLCENLRLLDELLAEELAEEYIP